MRNLLNFFLVLTAFSLCVGCGGKGNSVSSATSETVSDNSASTATSETVKGDSVSRVASEAVRGNSIYYWKTSFEIDSTDMAFLHKHQIRRLYVRMFDVAIEQNYETGIPDIVPIATTKFAGSAPDSIEIVPVTYITIDALRSMAGKECDFASLIAERLLAMSSYNKCGKIHEIQLDCDWTQSTKESYNKLCDEVKKVLQPEDIELSATIRLHQLQEVPPPVNRGVLMLYNTGAIKNVNTRNSILDIADVKPYIREMVYPLPLDYAYPAFGWGVKFKNNEFVSIVSEKDTTSVKDEHIRYERATAAEIMEVKRLVEGNMGKPHRGNILYHLDKSQLNNYTDDEICTILSY